MSNLRENVSKLAAEWTSNPSTHEEFRNDPVGFIEKRGITLAEKEKSELVNFANQSDEKIENRISKNDA